MKTALYTLVIMLVVAGIVHVATILLIPSYASNDAWAQLSDDAGKWSFNIVGRPGAKSRAKASRLPKLDPALNVAACVFDLKEASVRVEAGGDLPFWSVAVFDRQGQNIYSFNDRTAIERQLLMVVVNPIQRARLRKNPIEELEQAVVVETEATEGFILLRALQSDESWAPQVEQFLRGASCEKFEIPDQVEAPGS
ncbi:MAG: DUF1254 domain-containing protein [Rhizobiaceae bacterium]